MKIKLEDLKAKSRKNKITMLTCYDYSFAKILDEAGLDIILVGDSMANVVLGLKETRQISTAELLNHTKAVSKGVKRALVVADMPYSAYQKDPKKSLNNAKKFLKAGADAVKIEWFEDAGYVIERLIKNEIPVMGHIGLTPQTAHLLGGYKVQGRDKKRAAQLKRQAKILEKLKVFSLVLECIPYELSKIITESLKIPTIGIGAGKYCDGQVLVLYDLLGLWREKRPKFVKVYRDIYPLIKEAVGDFIKETGNLKFPTKKESFSLKKPKK